MNQPNQKSAVNAATQPKVFTHPTLEEALASLAKDIKMLNPFEVPDPTTLVEGTESTVIAKLRLRKAHSFAAAKDRMENAAKKAVGITGGYNRVPSVVDGLRTQIRKNGDAPFTVAEIAAFAEVHYQANNVDRKKSKDGSQIYTAAILDGFRLVGNLVVNPVDEKFRMTPAFKALLLPPAPQK